MRKFLLLIFFFALSSFANSPVLSLTDKEALTRLEAVLGKQTGEYLTRNIKRVGDKTIELEIFSMVQGDFATYCKVADDYPNWRKWALTGINQKPGGGNYYVQVLDLKAHPKEDWLLFANFLVRFPGFNDTLNREFKLKIDNTPQVSTIRLDSDKSESSLLTSAQAILKTFPAPKKKGYLWLYFKGFVKIKYWLLYEAMPDRLLTRESSERIQIILDNYATEEARRLNQKK